MKKLLEYFKCVYANKFTFSGYLGLIFCIIALTWFPYLGFSISKIEGNKILETFFAVFYAILIPSSCASLFYTAAGFETFITYRRIKKNFKEFGYIREELIKNNSEFYCNKVGAMLARKEISSNQK